jgi:hypothetical protein
MSLGSHLTENEDDEESKNDDKRRCESSFFSLFLSMGEGQGEDRRFIAMSSLESLVFQKLFEKFPSHFSALANFDLLTYILSATYAQQYSIHCFARRR